MTQPRSRPYQPADADAVVEILNAIDVAVGRPASITAGDVHDFVNGIIVAPELDTRVVPDADGNLIAMALVAAPPPGGFRIDLYGGVHPTARGRKIGRALLEWQLARCTELHASHRAEAPAAWVVRAFASQQDETALALFSRFGLTPTRYSFDMVASTADVREVPVPEGLSLVGYRPELAAAVHVAHMSAFEDHWGFQSRPFDPWFAVAVGSSSFNASLSVLAMAGTEVAGYLLAYDDAIADRVYVGQLGVRREWRRRGLAAAMLARGASARGSCWSIDRRARRRRGEPHRRCDSVRARRVPYPPHLGDLPSVAMTGVSAATRAS